MRTLHHDDAVGLVRPSGRTGAGYRDCTAADLDRARHVLVWRELGFALEDIGPLLDGDAGDRLVRLLEQVDAVTTRIDRLQQVRAALQEQVRAVAGATRLTQEDKRELFGAADGDEAVAVAEASRQHLSRWMYDCPGEMQVGLGRMYVDDERFRAHDEERAGGLAPFVSTAFVTNGERLQAEGG